MCLRCRSDTFPFTTQTNSDISLINSGFNNFEFSSDTTVFPDENLKQLFTKCNSIETPFNDADHPLSIDSKCCDINDFNSIHINKNSSFAVLHLNIASLSKHFDDLKNLLSLLKYSFDIIGISEHKINKDAKYTDFDLPGYTFSFNATDSSHGGTGFFISNNLTFKERPDLLINDSGRLESTFIELVFPNKKNVLCGCIYKHPSLKAGDFSDKHLTPMLDKLSKEDKLCFLMGDFNINLLNVESKPDVSEFHHIMSSHLFAPYILQPTRIAKNSKTLIDNIFLNSIEFDSFSGNSKMGFQQKKDSV